MNAKISTFSKHNAFCAVISCNQIATTSHFAELHIHFIHYFAGIRQQLVNIAPSTESFPNWRTILSPTRPSTETKTSSVADISMGQTLENANLLQMIKTTLTGTRTRTLDQTNLSPTLYQGSGNSASQEPAEVSAESLLRLSSQDADETAGESGLPQLGMFATLSTIPSVTHLSTAVPFQLTPLETPSISKDSTSGPDMLAAVPSPSFSSLAVQSPHTINFSKSAVLAFKVPLSAEPESSFNTDSTSSQVSESRSSPLSVVSDVNSSMVNQREGPELLTDTMSFNLSGSTVHFTNTVGKEFPSGRTSFLSEYSNTPVPKILHQFSMPVTSRSVLWFLYESMRNVSSTGVKPNSQPFKPLLIGRNNDVTPLSSPVFQNKAEVPALFFHPVGTPHKMPQMSHQSSTALTNCATGSTTAPFMSSASESLAEVSSSTESMSSLLLPKSFIPDAKHAHDAVLPVPAFRNETDFLLRNAAHSSSTSTMSPLLTETNETSARIALTNSPSTATANKGILQIPLTVFSQRSVVFLNQALAEDLTNGAHEANGMLLPSASARTVPYSDGSPMTRTTQQFLTRSVTAKISTDFNPNFVLPYGSRLSKVSPDIHISKLSKQLKLSGTALETGMAAPGLAAITGLSNPELAVTNTSATTSISGTAHLPPFDADRTADEDRSIGVPTVVTPHADYPPPRTLTHSHFTSGQTSRSVDTLQLVSFVLPAWTTLPSFVSMTTARDSHSSGFSGISSAASESNLAPISSPKLTVSASVWTNTVSLSSADTGISLVKNSVGTAVREVPLSTSTSATEYRSLYSVVSDLQKETRTNNQPLFFAPFAEYTHAMSSQSVSHLPFTGAKLDSFPEFVIDGFALKTSPVPYPSLATVVPASLQEKNENTAENVTNFFTAGDINISAQYEAPLRLHVPHVNDAGVFPSSLESQTAGAGKMTLLAKTFSTTPALAFQLPDNLSLSAGYEIGAAHSRLPTKPPVSVSKPFTSALIRSSVTEEDTGSGNWEFIDSQLESSGYLVMADKNPATLSVEEWDTSAARQSLDPTSVSSKATTGMPLQTPSLSALQSVIITSVHPLPTQLTSAFFPTTNFTHSVITVLSGVSSGAIPTVGTSEAKPLTRKSSPASPVPASSFLSLGTENTPLPSVMALNTPVLTLIKNNTATKLTSVLSSAGAHTDLPSATRNTAASPVDMTAMFITSKSSTVMAPTLAPTAHVPRQIKTTVTDSQKFPSSEITKTSTPYPLTITAALTSITASAKATRLPPTRVENTSAPSETTAAAAFANMTAAPPLDCRLSWNLMVKTGMWGY